MRSEKNQNFPACLRQLLLSAGLLSEMLTSGKNKNTNKLNIYGVNEMRLLELLKNPTEFFENVRDEDWKPAFKFFLVITIILSIVTPIVNYFGIKSTDFSSAYRAQIIAYRLVENTLLAQYGGYAYLIGSVLILIFACVVLFLGVVFLHLIFRLMGGKGPILNAWKAMSYGVGPCILGGFLPYISLFAGFYSLILQLYVGPRVLYRVKESRAIIFLAIILALTFIEMFMKGTTVGVFK